MQPLDTYFGSPAPGYALLVNGSWGVGKSFSWSRYVQNDLRNVGKTALTISVAGLQSREDLDRALFQSSVSDIGSDLFREAVSVVGKAALRFLKVEPSDIKLRADLKPGTTVICLDDIERFSGEFGVLFGFIVDLIDGASLHCVLLADEIRAIEKFGKDYEKYRERIVGKAISFPSDTYGFCSYIVNGFGDGRSRDLLQTQLEDFVELVAAKKITNLRTVRFLLTELNSVIRSLPTSAPIEDLTSLFTAMGFWAVSVSRSPANKHLVSRAFSGGDLGIAIALRAKKTQGVSSDPDTLDRLVDLLNETGFSEEAFSFPKSEQFVRLMDGLDVDYQTLSRDFGLSGREENFSSDKLEQIKKYRNLDEPTILGLAKDLQSEIENRKVTSVGRLFSIYRNLHWLSRCGLLLLTPQQWAQWWVAKIDAYPAKIITNAEIDYWEPAETEEERLAVLATDRLVARCRDVSNAMRRNDALAALMTGGGAQDVDPCELSIFDSVTSDQVYAALAQNKVAAVGRFCDFFSRRLRIINSPQFVANDKAVAEQLARKIETEIPFKPPMLVWSSEMRRLAEILRRFAAHVDEYQSQGGVISV